MASLYGKHWIDMWADIPMDAVKEEWQGGLYGYTLREVGDAINYCAAHNKFPPTLPEFRELCKSMRKVEPTKAIPRRLTPDELHAGRKRLGDAIRQVGKGSMANRMWAQKLLDRSIAGEVIPNIAIRYAKEALTGEVEAN